MNNEKLAEKYGLGATEGQGSNMFIREETIYSYGTHFKIAVRLNPDKRFSTNVDHVFNSKKYSNSTAKQQSYVRRNLKSYIEIPDCNIEEDFLRSYLNELKLEVESEQLKQSKLTNKKGKRFLQMQSKIVGMTNRVKEVEFFTTALYGGQAIHFIKEAA